MSELSRDAHQIPRSSKACRCLFGPVDSEQLRQDCDALMASCVQEARERWNFDFVTETPLEGDFAWERVRGLGLPKLYLPVGPRDDLGGGKRLVRPAAGHVSGGPLGPVAVLHPRDSLP